jgi:hypothetical protein
MLYFLWESTPSGATHAIHTIIVMRQAGLAPVLLVLLPLVLFLWRLEQMEVDLSVSLLRCVASLE